MLADYTISTLLPNCQRDLALRLFDLFPALRKRYWGQHVWSRGYCVSTVGMDEERIRKYVKWQNQKDQDATSGRLFE